MEMLKEKRISQNIEIAYRKSISLNRSIIFSHSFQIDVKDIDLVEKISKKRQVSLSDVLRECVRREVRNWV